MPVPWRAVVAFAIFGGATVAGPARAADHPAASPAKAARARRSPPRPADAILPGFEALADGSTRLFVELSQPVSYEAKPGHSAITYVLKGARVDRRNNCNPLVTVHFNTPVTSARLVPHGRDLWFVVALRADVQPTVTMDNAKGGGAVLRIEFPKGHYAPEEPAAGDEPRDASPPAPDPSPSVSSPPSADRPDR